MSKILGEIEGSRSLLRVLVVQLTGRMHFGAARALEGEGYLQALLVHSLIPSFPYSFLFRQLRSSKACFRRALNVSSPARSHCRGS